LAQDIRNAGLGFTHIKGVGQEETGPSSEPSLLVGAHLNGDDKGHLKKVLTQLGQSMARWVYYTNNMVTLTPSLFTLPRNILARKRTFAFHANNSAAQYYSKLKGKRQFSFSKEGLDVVYLEPRGFFVRRDVFHV
jgi:hypothetical protein